MKKIKQASLALLVGLALTSCEQKMLETSNKKIHNKFIKTHAPNGTVILNDRYRYTWNTKNDTFTFNLFDEQSYFGYWGAQGIDVKPYGSFDEIYNARLLVEDEEPPYIVRTNQVISKEDVNSISNDMYEILYQLTIYQKNLAKRLQSKQPKKKKIE